LAQSSFQIKREIIDICQRIYLRGYVAANDGNVSVRQDENRVIMTPTGMSKGFLKVDQLVTVDMDGRQIAGTCKPSSEAVLHLDIYKSRADVNAVVHAHPPTATGFAVAGIPLTKCVLPEVIISVGSVPIAEYATPGSAELPMVMRDYLKDHDAVLLANHGALTVGKTLIQAHYRMETIEHFAKIMFVAYQLGNVNVLKGERVEQLMDLRERLGLNHGRPACEVDVSPTTTRTRVPQESVMEELERVTGEVNKRMIGELKGSREEQR
jgi:L-fuculose-phosphate aldolase